MALFLLRSEVLKLYRNILRTARNVSSRDQQRELTRWARRDFEMNKHHTDEELIKMHISRGKMMLKELQTTIQMTK